MDRRALRQSTPVKPFRRSKVVTSHTAAYGGHSPPGLFFIDFSFPFWVSDTDVRDTDGLTPTEHLRLSESLALIPFYTSSNNTKS